MAAVAPKCARVCGAAWLLAVAQLLAGECRVTLLYERERLRNSARTGEDRDSSAAARKSEALAGPARSEPTRRQRRPQRQASRQAYIETEAHASRERDAQHA